MNKEIKEPVKELPKEPAQEPAKEPAEKRPGLIQQLTGSAGKQPPPKKGKDGEKVKSIGLFASISTQDEINFARHLSIVIKAGIPLYQGLAVIEPQTESPTLKKIIGQLISDVGNGRFLADGLARYESVFGPFFVNIVRVGEASGTLSQNLMYLADELRKSRELSSKVRSAMVYPMVIFAATIGMVGFLTFFIFPKLLPALRGLNVALPASTLALIAIVNFLKAYGIVVLVAAAAIAIAVKLLIQKVKPVRYAIDRMILFIPVLSALSMNLNVVNFTRVFGLLLKSGMRIVEAVRITAHTSNNLVYERALLEAAESVQKGGQLADYLTTHKSIFPQLLSGMVKIGEDTGSLEDNLAYLSSYFEEEVDMKLHTLTSLLEPIMLLLMGGMVGFVAISIITPIYSIAQGIS
ncbi:MAG TPA: type II secretion system F family protein [Candidatus Paceibacterota bacterium]|nr:type II secretion system F family protein [Candidatus Paceibacterota bacterium]